MQPLKLVVTDRRQIVGSWAVPVECLNRQQFKLLCDEFSGFAESLSDHLARELGGRPPYRNGEHPGEAPVHA